jgi:hypothetical protein
VRRKLLTLAGFLGGAFAGTVVYRRSAGRRRDRLDVYFDDGSMVSLSDGSPEASTVLSLARRILETASP